MIKGQDQTAGLLLVFFSIVGIFASVNLPDQEISTLSSGFYPIVLFITLGLVGIALWWQEYRKTEKKPFPRFTWGKVLPMIVLLLLYVFNIDWLGFVISTVIYISLTMWMLGKRNLIYILGVSLIGSYGVYFIFVKVFRILLP